MSDTAETKTEVHECPVHAKLVDLGLTADQIAKVKGLGVEVVEDLSNLVETDLVSVGIPVVKARKLIVSMKTDTDTKAAVSQPTSVTINIDTVLPTIPDNESWLNALRTGGVLKIGQSTVMSAIRAYLAEKHRFYDIPKLVLKKMEETMENNETTAGAQFFKLRKQITRRSYGDLFSAIDGMSTDIVSEARCNEYLRRINTYIVPALVNFNTVLKTWYETWLNMQCTNPMMNNPMRFMGMMNPMAMPVDCGILRDACSAFNDAVNKALTTYGPQVVSALAYEASQIMELLSSPELPQLCGQTTHEALWKELGVNVPATHRRTEASIIRFVFSIMEADKVPAGDTEANYFSALYALGSQIQWANELNMRTDSDAEIDEVPGIGVRRKKVVNLSL